ncbi:ABC-2 family transporter protein [Eubacteriaceae bacterium CHKCI004]|nr:ABC-2 family transporter protein [Eubacteriaceae bacterium CHKCI004]
MLYRCIQAENLKLKHSVIYLAFLVIPIIPAIMGTFNYMQNLELLKSGWYSLWTQITLFYASFFYAPLIGIYCSYTWRLEHTHNNWNTFMSMPVSIVSSYLAKLVCIMKVTVLTQLWISILFFIGGKMCGLPGIFSPEIILWLLRGTLAAVTIASLQLLLSMLIRNFAIPIGIALFGSIAGMFMTNADLGNFWPYSLMMLGMNSNQNEDVLSSFAGTASFFASVILFFLLFFGCAVWWLRTKDVRS